MNENSLPFPLLSEADAAIAAASLAAASCSLLGESPDGRLLTAQRDFQAHYEFLLQRKWPEPAKSPSDGMNLD